MITRHHIALALGSMLILFFPLLSIDFRALVIIAAGVCTGAVLPDIQMRKPKSFQALSLAWIIVQVFRKTVFRFFLCLYRRIGCFSAEAEDKRLTHSLPGLCIISGLFAAVIIVLAVLFPHVAGMYYLRVFFAGIILGIMFHMTEDICTKKGLCPLYPFNESYRISGSIRPCNKEDRRIRSFHIQLCIGAAAVILINSEIPGFALLKWVIGAAALGTCMILMIRDSDVVIEGPVDGQEHIA